MNYGHFIRNVALVLSAAALVATFVFADKNGIEARAMTVSFAWLTLGGLAVSLLGDFVRQYSIKTDAAIESNRLMESLKSHRPNQ